MCSARVLMLVNTFAARGYLVWPNNQNLRQGHESSTDSVGHIVFLRNFRWHFAPEPRLISCRLFIEDSHESILVESQSPMMLLGKLHNCFSTLVAIRRPDSNKFRLVNGAMVSRF